MADDNLKRGGWYDTRWPVAGVVIFVGVLFSVALKFPFHFDDWSGVVGNKAIQSGSYFMKYWIDPYLFSANPDSAMYRPVTLTSYLINYLLCGFSRPYWHAVNLALHMSNTLLVILLARRVLKNGVAALFAGLLFGCHPGAVETAVYVSARSGALATMFFLCALLAGFRVVRERSRSSTVLVLSTFMYLLGLLSKEIAAPLPAVAVLLAFSENDPAARNKWLRLSGIWLGAFAVYMAWRRYGIELGTVVGNRDRSFYGHYMTQASVTIHYMRMILWPFGFSAVYNLKRVESALEQPWTGMFPPWLALLTILGLVMAAIVSRKKYPAIFVGISWFFITLAPEALVPLNQVASDRRLYLPMIGLIIGVTGLFASSKKHLRKTTGLGLAVALIFSVVSFNRALVWRSNFSLWRDATRHSPRTPATWINLGKYYVDEGMTEKGFRALWRAYILDPENMILINNVGAALEKSGRVEEAAKVFRLLTLKSPRYAKGWHNYGTLSYRLGDYAESERAFRRMAEILPDSAIAHLGLGNALYSQDKLVEAREEYRSALELDPSLEDARYNLAVVDKKLRGEGE